VNAKEIPIYPDTSDRVAASRQGASRRNCLKTQQSSSSPWTGARLSPAAAARNRLFRGSKRETSFEKFSPRDERVERGPRREASWKKTRPLSSSRDGGEGEAIGHRRFWDNLTPCMPLWESTPACGAHGV